MDSEPDCVGVEAEAFAVVLHAVQEMDLATRWVPSPPGPHCTCASPYGCHQHGPQPREHSVPCIHCFDPTWSVDAVCDRCRLGWTARSERQALRYHRPPRRWSEAS
jgi:hypothetical protein